MGKHIQEPWSLLGDFNTFLKEEEKIGHQGVEIEPCSLMQACVADLRLDDLHGTGVFHTWFSNQNEETWMRIKLDRAMGNMYWFDTYENAVVHFPLPGLPDHLPIIVSLE